MYLHDNNKNGKIVQHTKTRHKLYSKPSKDISFLIFHERRTLSLIARTRALFTFSRR